MAWRPIHVTEPGTWMFSTAPPLKPIFILGICLILFGRTTLFNRLQPLNKPLARLVTLIGNSTDSTSVSLNKLPATIDMPSFKRTFFVASEYLYSKAI